MEREWMCENFEKLQEDTINNEDKLGLHENMIKSQVLDRFLAKKFVSLKRYGGEGAESMMAFFLELFKIASEGIQTYKILSYYMIIPFKKMAS